MSVVYTTRISAWINTLCKTHERYASKLLQFFILKNIESCMIKMDSYISCEIDYAGQFLGYFYEGGVFEIFEVLSCQGACRSRILLFEKPQSQVNIGQCAHGSPNVA